MMEQSLTVAAAQCIPVKGNIEENLRRHAVFINTAAQAGVDVLLFPELSLTGYQPELATALAITVEDSRLSILKQLAVCNQMSIIVGAPLLNGDDKPLLGAMVFHGDGTVQRYCKMHLHAGERDFFSAGERLLGFNMRNVSFGLAICADANHSSHFEQNALAGCSVYLASMLISAAGYGDDAGRLQRNAEHFSTAVVMANYCGLSGGWLAIGKSAVWDENGRLIVQGEKTQQSLIIGRKRSSGWQGNCISVDI
jgi:predicted amidohydrolase